MSQETLEWWCVNAATWMQRVVNQAEHRVGLDSEAHELAEGKRLLAELDELVEKLTAEPEAAA